MKNATKFHTLMIAGMLSICACNNSTSKSSSANDSSSVTAQVDTAVNHAERDAKNAANEVKDAVMGNADSNFIVKASTDNAMELKVMQAGLSKGTSKELKAHARMMIADHKKLGDKIRAYADKRSFPLPMDDNGKADDALASLDKNTTGAEWDKAWVNKIADAHQDAIKMFEKEADNTKDAELKTLIADALPKFRSHYDMMKMMLDKMK